jgi:hypothetical protein
MITSIIFALCILQAASLVWAHDGINDEWYESLTIPGTAGRCCGGSDCKPTEAEVRGGHWWAALPDGEWIEVPDELVIQNKGNPVGQPVLCVVPDESGAISVRCFVPGVLS